LSGLLDKVGTLLGGAVLSSHSHRGDDTVALDAASLRKSMTVLRDDPGTAFDQLMDLTVVDRLGRKAPRFEVVYHLYSLKHRHRLRVKAAVGGDDPSVESISSVWKSADWAEREAWDMYGVKFSGHPDLRRILMYPEFFGHPLRKDYPIDKRQGCGKGD
jgi:NADH-quinone oxidoreductase subunit C